MKSKKTIYYLGGAVLLLIIFIVIGKKKGWIGQGDAIEVSIDTVKVRHIVEIVSANGKVQPEVEVKITPDVSGEIIGLYVDEGDTVVQGELLVNIDPKAYEAAAERSTASLNRSKADLANSKARLAQVEAQFIKAEASYNRNKKLFDESVISKANFEEINSVYAVAKAEIDAAEQNVLAAEYNVKSAAAGLKEARDNLRKTNIYSPVSGKVSRLSVEKGERVVQTSMMVGTEIMRIADMNNMEVNVEVNENDIVRVSVGDKVTIEVDAYLNEKFEGSVTSIANSANVAGIQAEQVTNFEVKIRMFRESYEHLFEDKNISDSPFRPGMSATVDIETATVEDVISIPIQAVTIRDRNEEKNKYREGGITDKTKKEDLMEVVFLYTDDNKAELQEVKTGIQDENYIQIKSGLEPGQEVIGAPYNAISKKLKNETDVKKVKKEDLFKKD
ncbi:MAG: efflux transporter periplasmic adaptor subunit [Bacteroidetes bacterium]|nr:efflux RND transporter periplasmic adaptor subunit [Bacteroidia bacterium]PCH69682.1 MAG: efflux transporter periplasmic adaptor subunit [Bacteroidota bacterium]